MLPRTKWIVLFCVVCISSIAVFYKVEFNKNGVVSLKLREFFYIERAAHPMSYLRAL